MNITGAFALILGAVFSTYVFMPKRRVLAYSLDPNQPGDEFLFNLLIAPVAIIVNLVASLPGTVRALLTGRIHSRVPATHPHRDRGVHPEPSRTASNRFGSTELFQLGKFLGVVFLFAGFLVSIEVVPRDPDPVHGDPAGARAARARACVPPRDGRHAALRRPSPTEGADCGAARLPA